MLRNIFTLNYSFTCRVQLKVLFGSPFLPRSSFLFGRWYQNSFALEWKSMWSSSCHRCHRVTLMAGFVALLGFQGTSGSIPTFSEFMRTEIVFLGQFRTLSGIPRSIPNSFRIPMVFMRTPWRHWKLCSPWYSQTSIEVRNPDTASEKTQHSIFKNRYSC